MWNTKKLDELCDIQSGLWKGKKEPFTKALVLRNTNFTAAGKFDYSDVVELEVESKQLAKRQVVRNDIILEKSGGGEKTPVGRVCIHDAESGLPYSLSNFTARIRVLNAQELDAQFLHRFLYFLYMSGKTEPMQRHSTGIRNLQLSQYKEIDVPLPPLSEQQRIVEKLDAAFAEIDRGIETCEEQISETVKLESHSLTSLFSSDEHIVRRVNEIAEIKGGKRLPKGKKLTTEDTGFPYIRVSDFNDNGSVDEESVQFVEPDVQNQIARYTISSDDVYVSIAGTIGKTGIVPPSLDNANLTENAAKLVLKEGVDRDFVYFFTRTSSFEKQAVAQTRQAAQPKLALERLGAVELPIYELSRQRQIAFDAKLLTEEITKVIANREGKLLQLAALKSAILAQELQPPQTKAA